MMDRNLDVVIDVGPFAQDYPFPVWFPVWDVRRVAHLESYTITCRSCEAAVDRLCSQHSSKIPTSKIEMSSPRCSKRTKGMSERLKSLSRGCSQR